VPEESEEDQLVHGIFSSLPWSEKGASDSDVSTLITPPQLLVQGGAASQRVKTKMPCQEMMEGIERLKVVKNAAHIQKRLQVCITFIFKVDHHYAALLFIPSQEASRPVKRQTIGRGLSGRPNSQICLRSGSEA
jgi:hypothetical protein